MAASPDDDQPSVAKFFGDLSPTHFQAVGGTEESLNRVTDTFYAKVFADPILSCMFRERGATHAQKLCWFVVAI